MVGKPASKGVIVVDVASGQIRWMHQEVGTWFDALAWSPDGTQLALAGRSQPSFPSRPSFVQIWQVQGWQHVAQYPISTNDAQDQLACGQLVWSPDGTWLAGFNDIVYGQVRPAVQVWHASTGQVLFEQQATGSGGNLLLDWLPDSRRLATSWQQGELDIWDTRSGATLFHHDPDALSASRTAVPLFLSGPDAAISPDGQRAALFIGEQGQLVIQLWDLGTASPLFSCQPVPGQYWCLTWSPNGRFLAVIANRQPGSFILRPDRVNIVLRVLPVG